MKPSDYSAVWCPVASCTYGEDGGKAVFRAPKMGAAIKARNAHLVSCHPGFQVPKGAIADRIPRLD